LEKDVRTLGWHARVAGLVVGLENKDVSTFILVRKNSLNSSATF
jgi:hypothetical protein